MQAQDGLAVDVFCCASLVAQSVKNLPAMQEMPWRRKSQPPPLFFLGKSRGQRSLVGYS